uniref:Secreted protein n=1 Tax=Physcomitrium patens TaxID=3218 RepID=A0A2K1K364_PHYPA|nr:hypothetical protein PHYPA_012693 [Physcomitrium patens]
MDQWMNMCILWMCLRMNVACMDEFFFICASPVEVRFGDGCAEAPIKASRCRPSFYCVSI